MKAFWLLLLLLSACDEPRDAVKKVKFFRDARTGLCFAAGTYHVSDQISSVFTWVPCEKIPAELIEEVQ